MRRRHKILLCLSVQFLAVSAQLQVKNFFTLTGRRDLSVNVIVQESTGHLLLGTSTGLYRFDGVEAQRADQGYLQLTTNITALMIDSASRTWIGTRDGRVYILKTDKLDSLATGKIPVTERITAFLQKNGTTFIGTYGNGIIGLLPDTLLNITTNEGLSDNVIYTLTAEKDGPLWCGTDAGISSVELKNGKPDIRVIASRDGLPDNIVRTLYAENGKLTVTMQDSGICYYEPKTNTFSRGPFFSFWTLGPVLKARTFGNSFFIATETNGIIQITNGSLGIYRYEDLGLQRINNVFFDDAHQLWLASPRGLTRFSEKRVKLIGPQDGLMDIKVLALAVDNNHVIWIGTTEGVSRIMTDDKGKIVVNKLELPEKYTISCAVKAPNGDIWLGTYGSGVIVLRAASRQSMFFTSETHGLPNDNISSIYFSEGGKVYISTLGGGLIEGRTEDGKLEIVTVYNEASGLGSDYVYAAITDRFGKLYAATDGGGLEVLHNHLFINLSKRFRLNSNNVFSLCIDSDNNVWAVTNADGVVRYDRRRMKRYTRREGLRDEQPAQLIASGDFVYAIHAKGIDKINIRTGNVSYYDIPEQELEPSLNAVTLANGRIYSGTNGGVLSYRTTQMAIDSARPSVFISSVTVNYRLVTDSIRTFSYNRNNLAISFSGVWLKDPDKISFRYQLAGLDADWQTATEGKTANYNNLRPGRYTFIVQSKNEEEIWSQPTTYTFVIKKPIWHHWWFWVAVVVAGATGIWLFVRYRLKSLQRENILLETRVRERTAEIEKQSRIIEKKNEELEQLSLVASKTDNVVLILDASGKLEYVNESFTRQHNMPLAEVRERYGETIFELSNHPEIKELVGTAVNNRKSVTYESQDRKNDAGKRSWQSSTLTPIFAEDGALKKIVIIDTDVTERKKQEQIIVQKNKDIMDSIYYAKKIQHAILPSHDLIRKYIPGFFCLYMTKDIVSGDFYWFSHLKDSSIIAAVDCTGHGVPGAFMSLIGYNLLNKIVNENRLTDPGQILFELNKGVIQALHKNDSASRDGMDIAICKVNHREGTLEFAGAMRPLWIMNNGVLTEIKADKIPIGTLERDREQTIRFTTHNIATRPGDRFFIFTDGYADQFGGAKDKKFSTARLKGLVQSSTSLEIARQEEALRQAHVAWKGENEQIDDILVIGFEVGLTPQGLS